MGTPLKSETSNELCLQLTGALGPRWRDGLQPSSPPHLTLPKANKPQIPASSATQHSLQGAEIGHKCSLHNAKED